ncbi:hypothetical protein [Bifidobacterium callitrichidarum]|uniref:Uncharacterized protein n=1 Tax=Bifidobacterium callitrichidarum TaxID=2052941 RepID=A0A2U2N9B8_9BIFI|nr:hypothetical protein [Bifidobacterium callitrichidarum]PWG65670.1 hypothetical protein DF196_06980 [Bifidobacterium callitrichidarum]
MASNEFDPSEHPRNTDGTFKETGKNQPGALPMPDMNQVNINEDFAKRGRERMSFLDQTLIKKAQDEYDQRALAPGEDCYRIDNGLYVSAKEFEQLPEIDRNRYIAWGNMDLYDDADELKEAWNDQDAIRDLAANSVEDDDANVYYTEAEVTYADDLSYTPEFDDKIGYDFNDGANEALAHHPDIDMEEGPNGYGRIVSKTNKERTANLGREGDGYRLIYQGPNAPEAKDFNDDPTAYRQAFANARDAMAAGIRWVEEGRA